MSFFIRNKTRGSGAHKRSVTGQFKNNKKDGDLKLTNKKKKFNANDDESIASSDEEFAEENQRKRDNDLLDESDDEQETANEKRLRLTKQYIDEIVEREKDKAEFDRDAVSRILRDDYLDEIGKLRKTIASNYTGHGDLSELKFKNHDSITCLCITSNGKYLYSGSKNGWIVKWSLENKNKIKAIPGKGKNTDGIKGVTCLALSSDGKLLVAGDSGSNDIKVFNAVEMTLIKNLQGHRGSVTGLAFRKDSLTLYSAAVDRCVKVWNMTDMIYVESLFGHQSPITSIDALSRERAITSGGFDGSIRIWKIVEESQMVFEGSNASLDMVKFINEENFLTGSDDGKISVWGCTKKKPLCSVEFAHGKDDSNNQPMWISSIATFVNTDLVATGSRNGAVKLWKCGNSFRSLVPLFEVEISGFINSMVFTPDGNNLIVGVGQEHKSGRWWRIPETKNRIVIIPLKHTSNNK